MKHTNLSLNILFVVLGLGLAMPLTGNAAPTESATVSLSEKNDKEKSADFKVDFASYDFGTVRQDGPNVVHEFNFTNTSSSPILIVGAKASCGCTRPVWTKEPIKPGQTGMVRVTFVPRGQKGYVSKNITVNIITQGKKKNKTTLKITGNVTP